MDFSNLFPVNKKYLYLFILLAGLVTAGGVGYFVYNKWQPQVAPKLVLPDKVSGTKGAFIVINASTDCEEVKWYITDPSLSILPSELGKFKKSIIVVAQKDGHYKIVAITANRNGLLSEFVETTLYVGEGPVPPVPPEPEPTDPFFKTLKEAYNKETVNKDKIKGLQEVYYYSNTIVNDPRMKTLGDVYFTMHEAVNTKLGGDNVLKGVRSTLEIELNSKLPTATNTVLTEEVKNKLNEQFKRIAELLKAL